MNSYVIMFSSEFVGRKLVRTLFPGLPKSEDRDRSAHNQLLSMGVRDQIRQAMDHHASQPSFQYEARLYKFIGSENSHRT